MFNITNNLEAFLSLPAKLYEGDPFFVAREEHLPQDAELFVIPGVARAAVMVKNEVAKIGWFEAFDEPAAVAFLFDTIKAKTNKRLVGPMNGSTWHKYRVTLPDDNPPFFLDNYNKTWYAKLFEDNGFKPLARYTSSVYKDLKRDYSRVERFEKMLDGRGVVVRKFNNDLRVLYDLSIKSFANNFFYTPISYTDFEHLYKPVLPLLNPDWVLIAEDKNNAPLAFVFALENRMERSKKSMVMKTLAKLPDCGIKGLGAHLLERLHKQAFESGYDEVIHALMHESNVSATILADGAELLHTYVLYEWKPDD